MLRSELKSEDFGIIIEEKRGDKTERETLKVLKAQAKFETINL